MQSKCRLFLLQMKTPAFHGVKKYTKKESIISTIEIQKSILFVKDTSPHFFFVMMCLARRVEPVIDKTPVNFGIISNERKTLS